MLDVFGPVAGNLLRDLAPTITGVLGTLTGSALAGKVIDGVGGKILETLAEKLGADPTPTAIKEAIETKSGARDALIAAEAQVAAMLPLWQQALVMAQQAQSAELEKGFSSWNARRNFAHYTVWGLTALTGLASTYAALRGLGAVQDLIGLFATSSFLVGMWTGVNSGGKAMTDIVREWKSGK